MQRKVMGEIQSQGAVQQQEEEEERDTGWEVGNKQGLMCLYYSNLWGRVQCKQHGSTDHHFNHSQINACTVSTFAIRHFIKFESVKYK